MYSNISCEEIRGLIGKIEIIDIRDNYLYKLGSIPTSKNIPVNFLLMNPNNYLDKNKTYYIYCAYGIQSKRACINLTQQGYKVVNILGGYNSYFNF